MSGGGAAAGRSSWRPLEGNRRNLCARRGGSVPGEGGSPAWTAPAPQGERGSLSRLGCRGGGRGDDSGPFSSVVPSSPVGDGLTAP